MKQLKSALLTYMVLVIITGIFYPFIVFGFGQMLFPEKANGSLITVNGEVIGSELIGQNFSGQKYLWSRPSATSDFPYNAMASGGSNLGPSNPQLFDTIKSRVQSLGATSMYPVPVDLVTASGSGLDPEISVAAAYFQVDRIAKSRGLDSVVVKNIINKNVSYPFLGIFGESRVNVLKVNLALDK
ncbi:MAG TPA: potassium-transporting ATPase subunit KdpC [Aquella sp.]|nr:potassium-transporting ATPase subunit KdpC [Aquella sp.]